jgi:pimeloyl-ACP methyl ester carboxylesterase/quercetin dioxygenase-like cupin family protein
LTIDTPLAKVATSMLMPHSHQKLPCVVIAGGTLSHDRNGRMFRAGAPPRDALLRLAQALEAGGYASLRYDKVGFGGSKPKDAWRGTYAQEAEILAAVIGQAHKDERFGKVVVAGESAGAYVACLAAKAGTQADAYVFLGAHCGPGEAIYAYNFGRLVAYVDKYTENRAWAKDLRTELALGRHYKAMFQAAADGKATFELVDGDFRQTLGLKRRREELDLPPDEMFRHIKSPALALAGEHDLNVPPDHAPKAVEIMRKAGNAHAAAVTIRGADHSFQAVADSEALRMRERHTLESFRRPYQVEAYEAIVDWLRKTVPTPAHAHPEELRQIAQRTDGPPKVKSKARATAAVEVDPKTQNTPERIQLAPGVEIVTDITDAAKTAGVETLEGRIGPLLLGDGSQAHFIDMPGGMYVEEHPHSSESIIYTVRGQWVLCSKGRRQLMKPGTLFRFAAGAPTGYEVPFAEPAYILIFKGDRVSKDEKEFIDYLKGMADRLKKEQREGVPYLLKDLPEGHAGRAFGAKVNAEFSRLVAPGQK